MNNLHNTSETVNHFHLTVCIYNFIEKSVPALWETCAWPVGKLCLSTGCVQVFHGAAFSYRLNAPPRPRCLPAPHHCRQWQLSGGQPRSEK